jgi:hypothetical protein
MSQMLCYENLTPDNKLAVRIAAAEISSNVTARIVSAIVIHDGVDNIKEISPLIFAKDIEDYILRGEINNRVNIFRFRR